MRLKILQYTLLLLWGCWFGVGSLRAQVPDTLLYNRAPVGLFDMGNLADTSLVIVRRHTEFKIIYKDESYRQELKAYMLVQAGQPEPTRKAILNWFASLKNQAIGKQVSFTAQVLNQQGVLRAYHPEATFTDTLQPGQWVEISLRAYHHPEFMGVFALQAPYPTLGGSFAIWHPKGWVFEVTTLNKQLPVFKEIHLPNFDGFRVVHGYLPPFPNEFPHLYSIPNMVQVAFFFKRQQNQPNKTNLYNWDAAATSFYDFFGNTPKQTQKQARKILRRAKLKKIPPDAQVKHLEVAFKQHFKANYQPLSLQLNPNRAPNTMQATRLFGNILQQAGIPFRYGMAGARYLGALSTDLTIWDYLAEPVIYLPNSQKFIFPGYNITTYDYPPPAFIKQNALLIVPVDPEKTDAAVALFKEIPAPSQLVNTQQTHLHWNLTDSTQSISGKRIVTGAFLPYYSNLTAWGNDVFAQDFDSTLALNIAPKPTQLAPTPYQINDTTVSLFTIEPTALVKKTNDSIVINAGLLLSSSYCPVATRKNTEYPINLDFASLRTRTLEVVLPKGYAPLRLQDFNQQLITTDTIDSKTFGLRVWAKVANQKIILKSLLHYQKADWPAHLRPAFFDLYQSDCQLKKLKIVLKPKK